MAAVTARVWLWGGVVAVGGVAGIVAGQPLDTIKTRMQASTTPLTVTQCVLQTARQEGVRAFYKGLTSPVVGNLPINAIVFGARGQMDRILDTHFPRSQADVASGMPSYARVAASSAWAGTLQLIIVIPVENIKCKLQVQHTPVKMELPKLRAAAASASASAVHSQTAAAAVAAVSSIVPPASAAASAAAASVPTAATAAAAAPVYSGSWDCLRQLYRSAGLRGVYAGGWVTAWRDVPAYAAWFLAYDYTRVALTTPEALAADKPVTTQTALIAGSVAGIATWISTYPFDVIKSVIQTAPPSTPQAHLKIAYVARTSYKAHGMGFFFKGLAPTLLRAVPVSAVTFYVYERCMDLFGR